MAELKEWQKALVAQKEKRTGTIVAGYEWMIRFNKIKNVDFETFQDDFNLQARGEGENNFASIAEAVKKKYPFINIKHQGYDVAYDGAVKKIDFLKELVEKNVPSMLSLALSSKKDIWHQMPVTFYDDRYLRLVWRVDDKTFEPDMLRVTYDDVGVRHQQWDGGKDIAWLEPV